MSVVLPIMTQSISLRTYEQTNKLIHLKPFGKDGDGAFNPGSISSHRLDSRHAKHLNSYLRLGWVVQKVIYISFQVFYFNVLFWCSIFIPEATMSRFVEINNCGQTGWYNVWYKCAQNKRWPFIFEPHISTESNWKNAKNKSNNCENDKQDLLQLSHLVWLVFKPTLGKLFSAHVMLVVEITET